MVTKMMKLEMPTLQEVLEDSSGNEFLLEDLLNKFRLWLTQQIHLPQDISKQRLTYFISTVKFDFEKAKKNFDTLYTLHNRLEMYGKLDPLNEDTQLSYKVFQFITLPKLSPERCRVHLLRLIDYDASKFDSSTLIRYILMITELRLEEDIVTNNVLIWDCFGLNIRHITKFTLTLLRDFDTCLAAYGLRVKAVYVINAPQSIDVFMKLAKPVLRTKIFERIHIHTSGIETLYDVIPKSILPMEYGGEQPSMNTLADMWRAKLVKHRDWFLKEEKRKANEFLRKNSIINPDNLLGVPGTFRQLQID